ncbi:MAG: hypothetical protein APU95_01600 [Hadesarchaea archaeon YNP_N21]|nr:MAG: hypothetical protein APU95_01600 [Hadesarchaea archaeon YNP_N21]
MGSHGMIRSIVIQGLFILPICAIIELSAGSVLTAMEDYLTTLLPGLIVMVPPLIDLRGNINGALASRLGTALHSGVIEPTLKMSAELKINLASSLILSFIASASIGAISYVIAFFSGLQPVNFFALMAIALIAGFLSGVILAVITVVIAISAYRRGWDPDNVTSPTMATIGDIVTVLCIYLAVLLLG